jgi:hypothetical protein
MWIAKTPPPTLVLTLAQRAAISAAFWMPICVHRASRQPKRAESAA